MKEIEAKLKLSDLSLISNLTLDREVRVLDIYFDNGTLKKNDKVLRFRRENDKYFIAFKGPREKHKDLIVREEIETSISSFDDGLKIVKSLGFIEVSKVEKIRKYFSFFKYPSLSIAVDRYPFIKEYIEIEGNENEVYAFLKEFDLKETVQKNCTELFLDYCKENKLMFDNAELHFTFEDEMNQSS